MFKRILSVALVSSLVHLSICIERVSASTKSEKQAQILEKVKAGINKLGVAKEARVVVRLNDKTRLSGYISEAGYDSFVITNMKTGTTTTVAYNNVAQVKGHNLSTREWVGVGFVVFVLILFLTVRYWAQ